MIINQLIWSLILVHFSVLTSSQPIDERARLFHHDRRQIHSLQERPRDSTVSIFVRDAAASERRASVVPGNHPNNEGRSFDVVQDRKVEFQPQIKEAPPNSFPSQQSATLEQSFPTAFVHRTFGGFRFNTDPSVELREGSQSELLDSNTHELNTPIPDKEHEFADTQTRDKDFDRNNKFQSKDFITLHQNSFNSEDNVIPDQGQSTLKGQDFGSFHRSFPLVLNSLNLLRNANQDKGFSLPIQRHFSSLSQGSHPSASHSNAVNDNGPTHLNTGHSDRSNVNVPVNLNAGDRDQSKANVPTYFNADHTNRGNSYIPIHSPEFDSDQEHLQQPNKDQNNIAHQDFNPRRFLTSRQTFPTFPRTQQNIFKEKIPSPIKLKSDFDSIESSTQSQSATTSPDDQNGVLLLPGVQNSPFGQGFVLRLEPSFVLNDVASPDDIPRDFFGSATAFQRNSELAFQNHGSPPPKGGIKFTNQNQISGDKDKTTARFQGSLGQEDKRATFSETPGVVIDFRPSFFGRPLEQQESNLVPQGRSLANSRVPFHRNAVFTPGDWEKGFIPSNFFGALNTYV